MYIKLNTVFAYMYNTVYFKFQRTIVLKLLIAILLTLTFFGCENKDTKKKEKTTYEKYATKYNNIPWEKDLSSAFAKAKKEHKIVLVMAVSQGCKWCEKMESETLSDKEVLRRLKDYVLVLADRETKKEREQLPPFKHVPVIFFMTHEKDELDSLRGYFDKEDFLDYLNDFENE